jgi:hypothetical protein
VEGGEDWEADNHCAFLRLHFPGLFRPLCPPSRSRLADFTSSLDDHFEDVEVVRVVMIGSCLRVDVVMCVYLEMRPSAGAPIINCWDGRCTFGWSGRRVFSRRWNEMGEMELSLKIPKAFFSGCHCHLFFPRLHGLTRWRTVVSCFYVWCLFLWRDSSRTYCFFRHLFHGGSMSAFEHSSYTSFRGTLYYL